MRHESDGVMRRTCADCAAPFVLSEGEVTFFAQRALSVPTRCGPCRRARKGGAGAAPVVHGWNGRHGRLRARDQGDQDRREPEGRR